MEYYVGVDLGATNVRVVVGTGAASAVEASVVGRACGTTPNGATGEAVTAAMTDAVRDACDDAGVDPATVEGAAVGSIGPLDLEAGAVVDPVNFEPSVTHVPLRNPLADLLETPDVAVLNDTSAGAVGECVAGPDALDDLVYLTISTGIGAGACVDGRVLAGANGNAGEVGHTTVDPHGDLPCGCGASGHWEAYCSGDNIPRYARALHEGRIACDPTEFDGVEPGTTADRGAARADDDRARADGDRVDAGATVGVEENAAAASERTAGPGVGPTPLDGDLAGVDTTLPLDSPEFSAVDVFDHADTDDFAAAVVERIGAWNAIGVANVVHAFAPSRVAVGGAVACNNPERILEPIRRRLPAHSCIPVPEVSLTRLGDDVVVLGALAWAQQGDSNGSIT